jgi:formate-dependent phosphoribosylglycinamide formyltransferase (GAR transformylase)
MKRVLLLAATTGYQTRMFGDAADRLGVELVFATDRCDVLEDPWHDRAIPVRFHDEDASVSAIVAHHGAKPVNGILVVGDRPTVIAALAARELGLAGHQPPAAAAARNKLLTRERLRDCDLRTPWFFPTSTDADPEALARMVEYPCVVKPLMLSASRGVMRADDRVEFVAAFNRLRGLLASPEVRAERIPDEGAYDTILVEGFIEGWEFALEGIMHHGALNALALFDKPDPLDGPFFEETIYLTPSTAPDAMQWDIVDAVARAAAAIGLSHGPVHAECRVNDRGVYILEVAGRPIGGLCAKTLRFQRGGERPLPGLVTLEELLMRHALGESPNDWRREGAASGVMMIPIPQRGIYRSVSGVDDAKGVSGVSDVQITAKPDQLLLPLPEGSSYLGFIFARAATPEAVEHSLRDAHARLRFAIDPELPMLQSSNG